MKNFFFIEKEKMSNSNVVTAVNTMISFGLNKMYGIDTYQSIAIAGALTAIYSGTAFLQSYIETALTHLIQQLPIVLAVGILLYFAKKKYVNAVENRKKSVQLFYTHDSEIFYFMYFMKNNERMFEKLKLAIGNPYHCGSHEYFQYPCNTMTEKQYPIKFHDTIHNIKGEVEHIVEKTTTVRNVGNNKETSENSQSSLRITFESMELDIPQYFEKLKLWYEVHSKTVGKRTLYFIKFLLNEEQKFVKHSSILYNGKFDGIEKSKKKYIDSYFSPNKTPLWNQISNIHFNADKLEALGCQASCNLLLHGPPGTGKSSLIWRFSMMLQRHIVSVDLLSIRTTFDAYEIFRAPKVGDLPLKPNEYIIVLEEIDNAIKVLNEREREAIESKNVILQMKKKFLNKMKEKDDVDDTKKMTVVNCDTETSRFKLSDLLELIQGTAVPSGSIIIATTNHFDEIKTSIPALFRPGRLTPVLFDYLDYNTLQELSMFYFEQELEVPMFNKLKLPTSKIIELAIKYKSEEFREKGERGDREQLSPLSPFSVFEETIIQIVKDHGV